MEFSPQELVELVEKASTLAERLGPSFTPAPPAANSNPIETRLEQWQKVVAPGQPARFAQRLAWDGLDVAAVGRVLGGVKWTAGQPLPAWTETLQAALRCAAGPGETPLPAGLLEPADPLPFEDLLLPFINIARQKVRGQAGPAYALLSETAHVSLERSLLTRLAYTCAQALTLEFALFRLPEQPASLQPWLQPTASSGQSLYHRFINELRSGKLVQFFQKYPVLARLAATTTDFWVEAAVEFLQRLAADLPEIQQAFAPSTDLGQVIAVQPALSDPHHRGRSVIALQFAAGLKLVYKPRNLGLEVSYFQLLAWLNRQGAPLPFKLLTILNRPGHGWVEYVTPASCQNEAEARRYYRRAGMLLALLYTLTATDCHFQNIIACGDQPVIIDVDMLLTPALNWLPHPNPDLEAQVMANRQLTESVLYTGMVPRWEIGAGQSIYDISGLGAVGEQDMQELVPVWHQINQDTMTIAYVPGKIQSYTNAPLPAALNLTPAECDEELICGFQEMYSFLLARQAALLAPTGPLAALAGQCPRFMLRNTRGYFQVLQKSLQPKFLRDGVERSIQLDILSRWMLTFDQRPACWPLLAWEHQALAQLDIPYFAAPATSVAFSPRPGETIEQLFRQSSFERVMSRVRQLSQADMARQVEIIQASAYARLIKDPHAEQQLPAVSNWPNLQRLPTLNRAVLIQQAVEIAGQLNRQAVVSPDGQSRVWLGLDYLPDLQRYQFQMLRFGFYGGNGGLALFLATLARVTGDDHWRSLALSTLQPVRYGLAELISGHSERNVVKMLQTATLGGAQGLGSLFYVLTRTGSCLGEPSLLAEARHLSALLTPEVVAVDDRFDVLLGAAGSMLGLLALHRATGDPAALAGATLCGQHLLAKRAAAPTGHRVWPTLQGKFLTGFAHGAAGIAYALLRLHQALKSAETRPRLEAKPSAFLEAAKEAIAYEQSLFSAEAGNWPDLRAGSETPTFGGGWCHGAAGIGLARLGGLAALDTPAVRQDIAAALQISQQAGLAAVDHLCCGNAGRLDLLLVAAQQLNCPELLETAHRQAAWILDRARQAGSFQLFSGLTRPLCQPGLFRGLAGVGYQLLRLAEPAAVPSVLLWS